MVLSGSAAAQSSPRVEAMRLCAQYVRDPAQARQVCQRCPLDDDPAQWVLRLPAPLPELWLDESWGIRWASLKLSAKSGGPSAERRLAALVASGDQRERACLTALHVAGQRQLALSAFLASTGDPSARTSCLAVTPKLLERLHIDLFEAERSKRLEALHHLAVATSVGTGRVVLDALKERPPSVDSLAARLLIDDFEAGAAPAGLALLRDATEADTATMNRLLAVYSALRDTQREPHHAADKAQRGEALTVLRAIAPLSQTELTEALGDPAPGLRLAAAQALAAGEGRTLGEAARARLDSKQSAAHVTWLWVLAEAHPSGCAELATAALEDVKRPASTRAAALAAVAACEPEGPTLFATLARTARSPEPALRAATFRAASMLRREAEAVRLVQPGLVDPDQGALIAALEGCGTLRLRAELPRISALTNHSDAAVRVQALRTVMVLDAPRAERMARSCLSSDPDATVREGCASLLAGSSGGPATVGALVKASKNDSEARVKLVAGETLRKLGVALPRSISP